MRTVEIIYYSDDEPRRLGCLRTNLSDDEICDKYYIWKNLDDEHAPFVDWMLEQKMGKDIRDIQVVCVGE